MRPLRYSINVTLDGCCDHRAMFADEDLHRHAVENLDRADALLFGRVTYEMMEAAFRPPARTGARADWMEPFARTIDAAKKYVVSGTLDRVDWHAELVRGDLREAVQRLKREAGKGLTGVYARVSTQDQQAIPMQTRALREYATRRGWTIYLQVREVNSEAARKEAREKLIEAAR